MTNAHQAEKAARTDDPTIPTEFVEELDRPMPTTVLHRRIEWPGGGDGTPWQVDIHVSDPAPEGDGAIYLGIWLPELEAVSGHPEGCGRDLFSGEARELAGALTEAADEADARSTAAFRKAVEEEETVR